jgi:two-component system, OmpR family, sensor histidine kinase PhoQ
VAEDIALHCHELETMLNFTSIRSRLTLSVTLTLIAFIGLTGFAIEKSYRESARIALKDRIQGFVFTLLAGTEVNLDGVQVKDLPEAKFYTPGSGLYANISTPNNPAIWRSPSLLGTTGISFPEGQPGETRYQQFQRSGQTFLAVSFTVIWERDDGKEQIYSFNISQNLASYEDQISGFQQNLWGWLVSLALMLLLVQVVVLRWGLNPLKQVAIDLILIKQGEKQLLEGHYPDELQDVTSSLNDLLHSERAMQTRYRHSLGDLAHSLKTPLAVLQGEVEQCQNNMQSIETLEEQIERMNHIVKYQLQRAVSTGGGALAAPILVKPIAEKIILSLQKVYLDKSVHCDAILDEKAVFHGDEGDLYEVLGNILDNAFKWCVAKVAVNVQVAEGKRHRPAVRFVIEDDGKGVADDQKKRILRRGVRADEQTPGWGIGLSMVTEIVDGHAGQVAVFDSKLGGAKFFFFT